MKKVIAVSAGLMPPDESRAIYQKKQLCYLENDLATWLISYDIMPLLIPNLESDDLRKLLKKVDGLVLQGGTDIAPANYGEHPINSEKWPGDIQRDRYELELLYLAMEMNLPVLGICRGAQLLNVYHGGTLFQDLSSQINSPTSHRDSVSYDLNMHEIMLLNPPFNTTMKQAVVNSIHHQGIKVLAPDLEGFAFSKEDGLTEAFYSKKNSRVLGVQWHPEFQNEAGLSDLDRLIMRLFLGASA